MRLRPLSALLVFAAGFPCALAWADGGPDGLDARTAEFRGAQRAEVAPPATGRARFMACGYVAPGLDVMEAAASGGDEAFARMLERLKGHLLGLGAAR